MSMKSYEAAILREARFALKKSKLRQKDILEWSTGVITERPGERVDCFPENKVWIATAIPSA